MASGLLLGNCSRTGGGALKERARPHDQPPCGGRGGGAPEEGRRLHAAEVLQRDEIQHVGGAGEHLEPEEAVRRVAAVASTPALGRAARAALPKRSSPGEAHI